MNKEKYNRVELEVIIFQTKDIIRTSDTNPLREDDETELI